MTVHLYYRVIFIQTFKGTAFVCKWLSQCSASSFAGDSGLFCLTVCTITCFSPAVGWRLEKNQQRAHYPPFTQATSYWSEAEQRILRKTYYSMFLPVEVVNWPWCYVLSWSLYWFFGCFYLQNEDNGFLLILTNLYFTD